jgi:hypothetical protein
METVAAPQDELFELERRIARRADELTRKLGTDRGQALEHWRQAEAEVFGDGLHLPHEATFA